MVVGDVMAEKVMTIKKNQSLKKAHDLMSKSAVRHLPVVDGDELLGIITESDIRSAFILSQGKSGAKKTPDPDEMAVQDYMSKDPLTVYPETHIEDAALIIYKNKIGALPVLKQNKLVGLISISDMVGLFIELMGILHSSSRIDIVMGKDPKNFDKVSKIIQEQNLNVINTSMAPYPKDKNKRVYSFRLDLCDTKLVVREIKKAGFKVLAAIE
ncbi:MAG: CBS and ACT domain-containing protein [Nitrospinota bacterium]|nr:CBS and ACT domain-containing protein [Nitrospinota bacterium]